MSKYLIHLLLFTVINATHCMDNKGAIVLDTKLFFKDPNVEISAFAFNPLNEQEGAIGFTNGTLALVKFETEPPASQKKQLFQLPPNTGIPTHLSFCTIPITNSSSNEIQRVILVQQKKFNATTNIPYYSTGWSFLPNSAQNTATDYTPASINLDAISTEDSPIEEIRHINYTTMNSFLQAFIMSTTNTLYTYTFPNRKIEIQNHQAFHYFNSLNNSYYACYNNKTKKMISFCALQREKLIWQSVFTLQSDQPIGAYTFSPTEKIFVAEIAAHSTIFTPFNLPETIIDKRSLCYFCTSDGHYLGSTEIENAENASIKNLSFNASGNVLGVMLSNNELLFPNLSSIVSELENHEKRNAIIETSNKANQETIDILKEINTPPQNPFISFLELIALYCKVTYVRRHDIAQFLWYHKGKVALISLLIWYKYYR